MVIGVWAGAHGIGVASAETTPTEPEVQIGEARSMERSAPPPAVAPEAHDVAGVAVAGIAIARSAPPLGRPAAPDAPEASTFAIVFVSSCGAVTLSAALWQLTRRRRHALL